VGVVDALEQAGSPADTAFGMDDHVGIDQGMAGRSAQQQAERWRDRAERERASRSRLARALLGPSSTEKRLAAEERRWAVGARGEEMLAESLARRCPNVLLLHDRRMPRSRANVDHIAVSSAGVYVIDAKRYRGKIEVREPHFGKPKLLIAGRDRTKLIDGLEKQGAVVKALLADTAPDAPVVSCLCFVAPEGWLADSGLPVLRTLKVRGYPLYYPRRLARRLNESGPLLPEQVLRIYAELSQSLLPA
jgi:hypothetical protein